jgi:GNAT superfamily N-acetyltransferase
MVISAPRIEEATAADIAALSALRIQMGWSHATDLLAAILGWPGSRVFIIRDGELANLTGDPAQRPAVATIATAAPPLGVIGSVMVRPDYQRSGLGRIIMEHAVEWLRLQSARRIFLDATPAGRPLYRRLGFVDLTSSWYTRAPLATIDRTSLRMAASTVGRVVAADVEELPRLAALDRNAYGGDRLGLLAALTRQANHNLLIAEAADGAPLGYIMTRPSDLKLEGLRVGPLVAHDDETAAALLAAALDHPATPSTGALIASVVGESPRALAFFKRYGAPPIEDDLVMRLDVPTADDLLNSMPDDGVRAQAYCLLAPMVF